MSKRDEWEFDFSTKQLADAATDRKRHHEIRLAYWTGAKEKVMVDVRETGIEVSESLAETMSNTRRGFGPQVRVRDDLQTKLTECFEKMQEHTAKIKEYDGWVQVLSGNPTMLKLHADDYLYFFGK